MSKIEEMIKDLPPDLQQEVEDFVEFLYAKRISNNKRTAMEGFHLGSPEAVRLLMHEPPHLRLEDVDELEQEIEKSKLPIYQKGVFDGVKS